MMTFCYIDIFQERKTVLLKIHRLQSGAIDQKLGQRLWKINAVSKNKEDAVDHILQ